jgi:hypothetical protein
MARRKRSAQAWSKPSNFTSSTSWSAIIWTPQASAWLVQVFYAGWVMRVNRRHQVGDLSFELLDDHGDVVLEVDGFLRYLAARDCSPNTLSAYAHDLLHFYRFLERDGLSIETFGPAESLALLEYLRQCPADGPPAALGG